VDLPVVVDLPVGGVITAIAVGDGDDDDDVSPSN